MNTVDWRKVFCHVTITWAINLVPYIHLQYLKVNLGIQGSSHYHGIRATCPLKTLITCLWNNHHDISKHHVDFTVTKTSHDPYYTTHISHGDDDNLLCFRGAKRWLFRCFLCWWWVHSLTMITRYAWHSHFQLIKCRRLYPTNINNIYVWSK